MRNILFRVSALVALLASGCLTSAQRNEIFADGIQDAFIETKMAEQYKAYVAADGALGDDEKAKRMGWVVRVTELLKEHGETVVDDIKTYMITNGICDQYDAYVDADANLQDTSKYIRKRSPQQIRKLIATAEGQ